VRGRRRVIVKHADGTRSLHGNEAIRPVGWGLQVRDIVESELRKGITDCRLSSGWAARKRPGQPDDAHPEEAQKSVYHRPRANGAHCRQSDQIKNTGSILR
jgi:hypothetical protein